MDKTGFSLALGVFLGNWLLCPLISQRSFKEGFWIGLMAAVLVLLAQPIVKYFID